MDDQLRCPKCSASQTRYRVRTNDRICYMCGHTWTLEEEEETKDGT